MPDATGNMECQRSDQTLQSLAQNLIYSVRGQNVILDADVADFFERSTSAINQQRSRNADRFPEAYAFELTEDEWKNLLSQFVISRSHGGRRKLPWAYTEHGFTKLEAEAAKLFAEARKTDAEGAHVWVEVYQKRLGMLGQLRTMAAQLDRDAVQETLDHAFGVAGGVAALAAPSALPRMAR